MLELSSYAAALGENGSSVSVDVAVDKVNSLLKSVNTGQDHNGSENFFIINFHSWGDLIDNGGPNEVSIGISVDLNASAVKKDLGFSSSSCNKVLNSELRLLCDQRCNVSVCDSCACCELSSSLNNFWDPVLSVSDKDCN